jgi:hypothetical protein
MAWHECVNGNYVLCYRIANKKFRRTLKTTSKEDADDDVQQFETISGGSRGDTSRFPKVPISFPFCCRTDAWLNQCPSGSQSH